MRLDNMQQEKRTGGDKANSYEREPPGSKNFELKDSLPRIATEF